MESRSTLARLQQGITCTLLVAAAGWAAWQWARSPLLAVLGAVAIAFSYALFLAIEFIALRFVGPPGADRPSTGELFRAWLGEVVSAPVVFCWRQPFRWRAEPDFIDDAGSTLQGRRGAVFIHGFVCNRGFWTPWLRRMREAGLPFIAVNLEPVFGPIDAYAPVIEAAVARLENATGMPPVLVCHSMGGLAARAWLRTGRGNPGRVHHVVTIASPHHGTWLGRFSHLANGRQMRLQSDWLRALAASEAPALTGRFTCWYTDCDNIVFPVDTATLPGADNRQVRGAAHVHLAFDPRVMRATLDLICRPSPEVNFTHV